MTARIGQSRAHDVLSALDSRLAVAASALAHDVTGETPDLTLPGRYAAEVLPTLVRACAERPEATHWLLLTAVSGAFPTADEVETLARQIELETTDVVVIEMLERVRRDPQRGRLDLSMQLVTDAAVVDVNFCAQHDRHTGIQRVVRETMPRWRQAHDLVAVAMIDENTAYRSLTPRESARVFDHGRRFGPANDLSDDFQLVVPWRTVLVLPEVPNQHSIESLAGLARYSGNEVAMVGYDMIPFISPELRPDHETASFLRYLWLVKHAHRIAGISTSATSEFRGFAQMLRGQGIAGPVVAEVELAEDVAATPESPRRTELARPVVTATGSREPHKNLLTVLHAAERLWREGHDFELVMMGGPGWEERALGRAADRLVEAGRPLTRLGWVSDAEMWKRLRDANFTVFLSVHEGFGLPVAESLACGTPVITTDYGSQREIADKGGCLVVDPRDDRAVIDAMRQLLTDPVLLNRLRSEIPLRPSRRWDDYATEAWAFLVEGGQP